MSPVLRRLRRGIDRFLGILDSEGVALFQAVVYAHLTLGGAYGILIAGGTPPTLEAALGPKVNGAWLWLCVGATICLVGKVMSARPRHCRVWVHTGGLYLQLAGDLAALGAFAGYVLSTALESYWGEAIVAAFVFASLADCAFLLCWRDLRRIRQAEKLVRS
ncbi:hypothetical protein A5717_25905 [Mycolicibacterium porcinum]|uniref:hypothetical protein n=1 Tax=Mycolicibacterium porcinum TaxID=39693 RepID=UPI00080B3699|nr:hypothetical protein [Mycolicibacterium porcinum]OCB09213.1 hypothetical protein A5717_25905 [Mycolicibacterium porcinum]